MQMMSSYFRHGYINENSTPITAAQTVVEDGANVVNHVRQEVVRIDNYHLALSYLKLLNGTSDIYLAEISIDDIIRPIIMNVGYKFIESKNEVHYEPCT